MLSSYRNLVVALAGLIGLVGVATAYATDGPAPAPTPVPAQASPVSPGCGREPVPGPTARAGPSGDVVQSLRVGGLNRSYRLAVPAAYRRSAPTPLILLFHGSGSDALEMSIYTRMPERASGAGYLVATPDAVDKQWQLSAPGAATADLALVAALIADLSARYCVDPSRVYAAGFSLGSEFSAIAACTPLVRIAAVGLASAEFPLRGCSGPVPVIAFHGTADPLVAYPAGGVGSSLPGVHVPGVEQNMAGWAMLDGCRPGPEISRPAPMVMRRSWRDCRDGSRVVLYTVLGGGHSWPGSPVTLPVGIFGPTTRQIDATGLMLGFFGRTRLRR
jgi:polyhydroxybutyrate depolymerase